MAVAASHGPLKVFLIPFQRNWRECSQDYFKKVLGIFIHTLDQTLWSPDMAARSLGSMACIMFVKERICFACDYCICTTLQFRLKRKWK